MRWTHDASLQAEASTSNEKGLFKAWVLCCPIFDSISPKDYQPQVPTLDGCAEGVTPRPKTRGQCHDSSAVPIVKASFVGTRHGEGGRDNR